MSKTWLFAVGLVWVGALPAFGQEWEEGDNELEDVEVEIVKGREIKLPFASKNFEKVPPSPVNPSKPDLEYNFKNVDYTLKGLDLRVRPLKVKADGLEKTYGNYVKGGFGNFVTPYLEAFVANKRNKTHSYGAHFRHLSSRNGPIDDENSGSGATSISAFGNAYTKHLTLSADIGFDTRNYHFYGYEPDIEVDKDSIEQQFNHFFVNGQLAGNKAGAPLKYSLGASFDFLNDNFDAKENEVGFDFNAHYALSEATKINVEADLALITREDAMVESDMRTLFRLKPYFDFEVQDFKVRAGFNVALENDTLGDADQLHFYPILNASYLLIDNLSVYAGIRGNIEKTSLRSFTNENPFLAANIPIFHTNRSFDFYGGIEGKLSNTIGAHAGISIANYKNMYFFVNSPEDRSKFQIIYDEGNTAVFNLFAELSLTKSETFRAVGRVDYYGYNTDNVEEAWHKPNYVVSVDGAYTLFDKIVLGASLNLAGGIEAPTDEGSETLDPAVDMNLKGEYLISPRASAFLKFDNIFANEYELLNHYPVRGFQAMLGFTYNF